MFLRLKQSPSGRVLQLLESYRNPEGRPRHRVVISLGDAALAQEDWKTVVWCSDLFCGTTDQPLPE